MRASKNILSKPEIMLDMHPPYCYSEFMTTMNAGDTKMTIIWNIKCCDDQIARIRRAVNRVDNAEYEGRTHARLSWDGRARTITIHASCDESPTGLDCEDHNYESAADRTVAYSHTLLRQVMLAAGCTFDATIRRGETTLDNSP
jgi:hypothetical protein